MNKDAVVAITLGFSALSMNKIGLKKIPPPIPTTPDTRPNIDHLKKIKIYLIF